MTNKSIPVYVIALENSKRVEYLESDLKSRSINYQLITAINGLLLNDAEVENYYNLKCTYARLGYRLSKGLMACALSHQKVYTELEKTEFEWALILEEDARITESFNLNQLEVVSNYSNDFPTIVQLFSRSSRLTSRKTWTTLSTGDSLFEFAPRLIGSGTSGYLINRKAVNIANQYKKISGPPDWPSWHTQIKFKGIYPWYTFETQLGSMINKPEISKIRIRMRWILILTGLHYLRFRKCYSNISNYINEEIVPLINHFRWKLGGSKYFTNESSPQLL